MITIPEPCPDLRLWDMELAFRMIGVPYVWGGQGLSGSDCSGASVWRFRQLGIIEPTADYPAAGFWKLMAPTARIEEAILGSLCFYGYSLSEIVHMAYNLGGGLTIDAPGGTKRYDSAEKSLMDGIYFKVCRMDRRPDLLGFVDPFTYHSIRTQE